MAKKRLKVFDKWLTFDQLLRRHFFSNSAEVKRQLSPIGNEPPPDFSQSALSLQQGAFSVRQPVIWIYQPPRSGGTMFLRLFDSHPQTHVHPAPIQFRWPRKPDLKKVLDTFSMARFSETGFAKSASNRPQDPVPIEFDEACYRSVFETHCKETPRQVFDAAHTACFSAWRNYNNAAADKRYVMMHSTIWSQTPVAKAIENFFSAYRDGWTVFVARNPADWIASGEKLKGSKLNDTVSALKEYIASYAAFLESRTERSIVLEFNALVSDPKSVLSKFCACVGLDYHPALEITTINGTPMGPNSSHAGEVKYAPDPGFIGHGAAISDDIRRLPEFVEAERLYRKACDLFDRFSRRHAPTLVSRSID